MPVAFSDIPGDMLVPLFYAELQPAPTIVPQNLRMLLLGQRNSNWTVATRPDIAGDDYVPYLLNSQNAVSLFGSGSMLDYMYRRARENNPFGEIWGMSLIDDLSTDVQAVAASGTLRVYGNPATVITRPTWIGFFVCGYKVQVIAYPTDTRADLAARIALAMQRPVAGAGTYLPVSGVAGPTDPTAVTITCRWRGFSGNHIRLSYAIDGSNGDVVTRRLVNLPSGLFNGVLGGNLTDGLRQLGGDSFDVYVVGPIYSYAGDLGQMDAFMDRAWSPVSQDYGHYFAAFDTDYAAAVTNGLLRNGPHASWMHTSNSPSPPWEWASALAGRAAAHWANPPELSRPLHSLTLRGIFPPTQTLLWPSIADRQALLQAGVSTWTVDRDRSVRINRVVTNYQTNAWGDEDGSWRDAVTMFQAMYFARYMRSVITNTYPRAALTSREVGINGFTSPAQIRDTLVHAYGTLESLGLVENTGGFMAGLVVERNKMDPNRVDILCRADMVNQLIVVATLIETHLELEGDGLSAMTAQTQNAA